MVEEAQQSWESLTPRERDVAWQVRLGLNSDEIASKVGVNPAELQACLQTVYSKLGVSDPLGLALYVVYHRLALSRPPRQEGGGDTPEAAAS